MTTASKFHDSRVKAVLETWGSLIPKEDFLIFTDREVDDDPRFLKMSDRSDYKSHVEKTLGGITYVWKHKLENYDWFYFCDDDTFVLSDNLRSYLSSKSSEENVVLGHLNEGCYKNDPTLNYPSGGSGYAMTKTSIEGVVPHLVNPIMSSPQWWCDVTFGYALRFAGIPVIDDHVFYSNTPQTALKEPGKELQKISDWKKKCSFHYINIEKMHKMHSEIS
jgi:hypothetical protein